MSNDEKQKGPVETVVEALRSIEQRGRHADAEGFSAGGPSPDAPPGEEPESPERKNNGGDSAEPTAEENE